MAFTIIPSPVIAANGEFVDPGSGLKFNVLTEDASSGTGTVQVMQNSYSGTVYTIPDTVSYNGFTYTVTGIGYGAFSSCIGLTSVNFPDSVTIIGNFAFSGCNSLSLLLIPDSVTEIGISAFSGTGITSITIPASVEIIWDYAFQSCSSLTSVTFLSITPPTISSTVFSGAVQTVTVPMGTQADYGFTLSAKLPTGAHISPAAATITGVTVSPWAAEVERGKTMTFSATVSGSGSFSPAVTWSVSSTAGSIFSQTGGVLTVAAAEIASTLTVKAISLADQNVFGEATVSVKSNALQEQFSLPAGSTCYFDLSSMTVDVPLAAKNSALPDISLKWVPFTYVGTVNAYSLDVSTSGNKAASETAAANTSSRSLFLADHVVYKNITWNELNAAGLIFGNNYAANSVSYLLHSLSGGSNISTPSSNEWDQILIKGGHIHNYNLYSWGQDTFRYSASIRIIRGGDTVNYWDYAYASDRYQDTGFRPALEILNTGPFSKGALKTVTYNMGANGTLGSGSLTSAVVVYTGELTLPEITAANGFNYTGTSQIDKLLGWFYETTFYPAGTKLSSLPSGATLTVGYGIPAQNNPPARKSGIAATTTASVTANTACTLNLATIFEDTDNDPLTYKVSVNGADPVATVENYVYTPTAIGNITLVFKANDGTVDSTDTYTVALSANARTYILTISTGTGGSITAGSSGDYAEGAVVTIAASAVANYSFNKWTVTGGGSFANANSASTTFTMPAGAVTITAEFIYSGGGGGSSSGGGGATPATSTYNAEVNAGNGSNVKLPVTVDKSSGNASVDVGTGNSLMSDGKTAVITVPAVPDVDTYTLGIPVPSLSTQDEQSNLAFRTDTGTVPVPSNMLTGVKLPDGSVGISGSKAEISIGRGDKTSLPSDVKTAIGDKPLISLSLIIDGKQIDWSNPDAPVTVSIPYTPTAAELANPESIVIWYIDGSGNTVSVPNGHYDPAAGTVTFTTTHFSYYAVSYNKVGFTDVADTAWYSDAVGFIAARGITTGTGNGKYIPDAKLTRGEFIVMLMKAYDIAPDANPTDNFSDAGSTYYTNYLSAAKRLDISTGVGNNLFPWPCS